MTEILKILIPTFSLLSAFGIAFYCLNLTREITYITLADGRKEARSLPFLFKLLLPFAGNFAFIKRSKRFSRAVTDSDKKIIQAGFEGLIEGWEFVALAILIPIIMGAVLAILLALLGISDATIKSDMPMLLLLGITLFALQPRAWLSSTIKKRQKAIQRAMPFMIDLLTLSVEAGVDFMNALQRSLDGRKTDPLTEELIRVNHEIQLGTPRRQALKNLALRVDMADMRSFAFALIQADELGVSIGTILRIQSDQIRSKRFDRAERLANEAPVKMLFPLMLFIFPAVFIVLLAPILSKVGGGVF